MTDSRETTRRKAFRDRARLADPSQRVVSPRELCLVRGCLNLRTGANLCAYHDDLTDELGAQQDDTRWRTGS